MSEKRHTDGLRHLAQKVKMSENLEEVQKAVDEYLSNLLFRDKRKRVTDELREEIIDLGAKGMRAPDIVKHLQIVYGVHLSQPTVRKILKRR